jgi:two-component system phosphate regulon response regulator OmpR
LQGEKHIPHVLVVDDDKKIRDLLKAFLIKENFFVTSAMCASEAKDCLKIFKFDLMIFDIMMPIENGIDLLKWYREQYNNTPILMLSAIGETNTKVTSLECGADDYLVKPFDPRELLLRIEKILRRSIVLKKYIYFGNIKYDQNKRVLSKNEDIINLTDSESNLLIHLVKNMNKVVTRQDLSEYLGGINDRSIDVQIIRLRSKIENNPKKPIYLQTIRGKGYILYKDIDE